jgi:hypothetical protein
MKFLGYPNYLNIQNLYTVMILKYDNMKTLITILFCALVLCPHENLGQSLYRPAFQKGSFLVGGELAIGWGSSKFTEYSEYHFNTTGFTFAPKAALFLTNGLALGITADYTASKYDEYDFNVSTTDLSIGPLIRVYAFDGFFVQSSITFGKMIKGFDEAGATKFNMGVGYAFPASKLVFIEPVILYRNTKLKIESQYGQGETELKVNEFVVAVGVGIYFHKQP